MTKEEISKLDKEIEMDLDTKFRVEEIPPEVPDEHDAPRWAFHSTKPPELRVDVKLKQREAHDMYINDGDEDRDLACSNLQERFKRRFPGLLLIWDEANKNTTQEWQKFALKNEASGQKIRLVLVTNEAFEDDEMGSFLIQFEDNLEEYTKKSSETLRFKMGRFEK
jgi:hypothetical protein